MTGRDYLKIWYRVQIGATWLVLALMLVRNYEMGRHYIVTTLVAPLIILAIGLAAANHTAAKRMVTGIITAANSGCCLGRYYPGNHHPLTPTGPWRGVTDDYLLLSDVCALCKRDWRSVDP